MTSPSGVTALTPRIATAEDADAVLAFRCAGRRPRYAETAQKLIRRCGRVLEGDLRAPDGFRCILFHAAADSPAATSLCGISAIRAASEADICDWIVMGIAKEHQDTRLPDGRSMAIVLAQETARLAQREGYTRMVAQVHDRHEKSLHMMERLGFVPVSRLDVDYQLFAVDLRSATQ